MTHAIARCPRCGVAISQLTEIKPSNMGLSGDASGPCIASSDGAYLDQHPSFVVEVRGGGFTPNVGGTFWFSATL